MMLRYSRLRGLPVISGEGRVRGRVLDVVAAPEGEEMVVRALLMVPNRFALLAARFRPRPKLTTIPSSHVTSIDARGVHLGAHHG
ncbi:PRC-barrel domain-containing protein [Sinomonas sp.]|jgi:sporulation protein YlmC with PRC-barrel domain|uniref:PRC-barrel domain-containing protein n=1 Tax=Sinomonas sp. TaxID=1914986 RepID=UPI002FDF74E9